MVVEQKYKVYLFWKDNPANNSLLLWTSVMYVFTDNYWHTNMQGTLWSLSPNHHHLFIHIPDSTAISLPISLSLSLSTHTHAHTHTHTCGVCQRGTICDHESKEWQPFLTKRIHGCGWLCIQYLPSSFNWLRSWMKPRKGAKPVPGPIIIMGVCALVGNLLLK